MRISLFPQRRDDALSVTQSGEVLTINGEVFDFSVIPEGADLPAEAVACEFVVGKISRIAGELYLALTLPHGPDPSQAVAFPSALINPPDGLLALPFDPPVSAEQADVAALLAAIDDAGDDQ